MRIEEFGWVTGLGFKVLVAREVLLQRFAKAHRKAGSSDLKARSLGTAFAQDARIRGYYLRHLHLAVAFMRGIPYKQAESKATLPVNPEFMAKCLPYDWYSKNMTGMGKREDVVRAWLDGSTPEWKKKFPRRAGVGRQRPKQEAAAE